MADQTTLVIGERAVPVTVLTGPLERARGRMLTRSPPEHVVGWQYDAIGWRSLHMIGVPYRLRAAFVRNGTVMRDVSLRPMVGMAGGRADLVLEYDPARYELAEGESVSVSVSGRGAGEKSEAAPLNV